jgi:hypothetical protein
MSTISPGPATNAGTSAQVFEASRATDDEERGHLTTTTKGANAAVAGAQAFEMLRVASDPGH